MREYQFLISASYPYPYPYPIRSDAVNCYPYPNCIRSINRESKNISPDIFDCSFNTGCQILIPLVVFGTDVDIAGVCHNH